MVKDKKATSEYSNEKENKLHGEAGFPFSIYDCEIPVHLREVLTHWHEEMEIIYVKKGRGIISVEAQRQEICAPAVIFVLPEQRHSICQYGQAHMEYENYLFHPRFLQSRDNELFDREYLTPLFQGVVRIPFAITPAMTGFEEITGLLCDMKELISHPLVVKSLLYLLCHTVEKRFPVVRKSTAAKQAAGERLKPVLSYVQENYAEQIRVADAAALTDFSEVHFMRFFKEQMGVSFVTYLKNYRLTKAEEMVRGSQLSMLEIAQENGFSNFSYFIRAFKEKYGAPPLKYRESLRSS